MLPESKDAKAAFVEIRDYKSRWRADELKRSKGDWDALVRYVVSDLAYAAEVPQFMEAFDFAQAEGILTPEQIQAGLVALEAIRQFRESLGAVMEVAA